MLATLLLSALAAQAAPAKRQNSGYMITVAAGEEPAQNNPQLCMATALNGGSLGDNTVLGFFECSQVQTNNPYGDMYGAWDIQYGNQQGIQLVGTNFCLDAGPNPFQETSQPAKVYQCYPGLAQQQFYYTGDNHIAVTGADLCLDQSFVFGIYFEPCGANGYGGLQGDVQVFGIQAVNGGSAPAPTSTMATMTSGGGGGSPAPTGDCIASSPQYVFANFDTADESQCLTVLNGQFYDGSPVGLAQCGSAGAPPNQNWSFESDPQQPGVTTLQVAGTNYCLDFGDGGGYPGEALKIWQCYSGLFQQTFYWTADQHIAVYNGNQCLDYSTGTLQSNQCGATPQQLFNEPAGAIGCS